MGTKYEVNTDGKVYAASASLADKVVITDTNIEENTAPVVVMTSNTLPAPFVASASSEFSASYEAWHAFDDVSTSDWATAGVTTNFWVKIDYGSPVYANQAEVECRDSNECPNDWRIEGSNDDSTWVTLYSQSSEMAHDRATVVFTKTGTFRYYRMFAVTGTGTNPGMSVFNLQSTAASFDAPFSDNISGDLDIKTGTAGSKIRYQTTATDGELKTSMVIKDGLVGYGTESPVQRVSIVGDTLANSTIASTMYSDTNSIGHLNFIKSRGTEAEPTAILNNDFIADWRFGGQYSSTVGEVGLGLQIFSRATEDWNGSARGSQVFIASSKTGTVTTDTALAIDGNNDIRVYENLTVSGLSDGRVEADSSGNLTSITPKFTEVNQSVGSVAAPDGSWGTVTGCSITLTDAGTYFISYTARGNVNDKNKFVMFRLYDVTGVAALPDTESISVYNTAGTGGQGTATSSCYVTITGSRTYRLELQANSIDCESLNDNNGRTKIFAHRI